MYLSVAVIALFVISSVQAAGIRQCIHEGKVYPAGAEMDNPGKCSILTCTPDGYWNGKTCPFVPNLKQKGDSSKPYPDCCPIYKL